MFTALSDRLLDTFRKLARRGKLTETDVSEGLREMKIALLEADVNLKVVQGFIQRVRERAVGERLDSSLDPARTLLKIVFEEMVRTLSPIPREDSGQPTPSEHKGTASSSILLVGLHGSGKTTTAAKLANQAKKRGRSPLLVPLDLKRPAAIEQLQTLGDGIGVSVFRKEEAASPEEIALAAQDYARRKNHLPVIFDSQGRLQMDEELMEELSALKTKLQPDETLLILDSMTGQEAVNIAAGFDRRLNLTGYILTKLDGDAKGGAALSVTAVTGKPILYAGIGEKSDALEEFRPDRIASRILGMGDAASLIETAAQTIDLDDAALLKDRIEEERMDLEDFLRVMRQIKRMGSLKSLLKYIPGMKVADEDLEKGLDLLKKQEVIIQSMTAQERRNPRILNASRRRRIAKGSGRAVQEINELIEEWGAMNKMLKGMKKGGPSFLKGLIGR